MKLSIIITGRNIDVYARRSIGTVLAQRKNPEDVEVIFVDDSSTDQTFSTASAVLDGATNSKVIKTERCVGPGGARNLGVRNASGDYIYFHDGDDYLAEGGLDRILGALDGGEDVVLVPYRVYRGGERDEDHSPDSPRFRGFKDAVKWAVGPWSAVLKRSLYLPMPEHVWAEDVVWHFLQYDRFSSMAVVKGKEPVYVWDCTNPSAVTRTVEWFWTHSYTLEQLAFDDVLPKNNLKDKYVSDTLRNLAVMYDVRHSLKTPWVKNEWAMRFRSMCQRIAAGHFGH